MQINFNHIAQFPFPIEIERLSRGWAFITSHLPLLMKAIGGEPSSRPPVGGWGINQIKTACSGGGNTPQEMRRVRGNLVSVGLIGRAGGA